MSGWATASLGEIFEIGRGGSPRPISDFLTDDPNGVNWISIADATESSKFITRTERRIKPSGVSKSRMVHEGDFLLTNSMSFGRPYIMKTKGCIHDGWLVLSDKTGKAHPDFFYHLLGSNLIYREFERLASGATVKNLNIDLVSGVKVPLPPMDEQKRLAAILDAADSLRTKRRATLSKLDQIAGSIFFEMFGDSGGAPQRGQSLEQVADILVGYPFQSERYASENDGVRLCRGANVFPGQIDWSDLASWPIADMENYREFFLQEGDIVIAMDRPWISSGFKIARVSTKDVPSLLVQRVARIRARSNEEAELLYALLQSPAFTAHCKPTETTIPHISPKDIRSFSVAWPTREKIEEFAQRMANIATMRRSFEDARFKLDSLFASIQQRVFRELL